MNTPLKDQSCEVCRLDAPYYAMTSCLYYLSKFPLGR